MNALDDVPVDTASPAWVDMLGQDGWTNFNPVFGSLTVVGATAYFGRYKFISRRFAAFEVRFSAATSIASVAGTDYLTLPFTAKGLAGIAAMDNETTNVSVGLCKIKVSNSRCYLPTQTASANVFNLAGWCEV